MTDEIKTIFGWIPPITDPPPEDTEPISDPIVVIDPIPKTISDPPPITTTTTTSTSNGNKDNLLILLLGLAFL